MELHECLMMMRRRLWLVASVAVAAVAASLIAGLFFMEKVYESAATIIVSRSPGPAGAGSAAQDILLKSNEIQVYYSLAESESVYENMLGRPGFPGTVRELREHVGVNADFDTGIIKVSAHSETAAGAQVIAQAFIDSFTEQSKKLAMKAEIKIIDAPKAPLEPASPNMPLNLLLALAGGLLAGLLLSMFVEARQQGAGVRLQERLPWFRLLGCLPRFRRSGMKTVPAVVRPEDGFPREAVNVIKTNLLFQSEHDGAKVVLLTGPLHDQGTTTVSLNVAVACAQVKKKVLLVDCNFSKPALYKMACLYSCSMSAHLLHGDPGQEYISHSIPTLGIDIVSDFIPREYLEKGTAGVFAGTFIDDMKPKYDLILIDGPPLLLCADARTLSRLADGVVLIADYGRAAPSLMQKCSEILKSINANVMGVAVNRTPAARTRYLI